MPKRKDAEIMLLQYELESGKNPELWDMSARQLMNERPELKRRYGDKIKTFDKFWGRMRKKHAKGNLVPIHNGLVLPATDGGGVQAAAVAAAAAAAAARVGVSFGVAAPAVGGLGGEQASPSSSDPNNANDLETSYPSSTLISTKGHKRSVRVRNTETNRDKDLVVPVSEDVMCFDAIYNNESIKNAKLRVWTKATAQDIKENKKEIEFAIVSNDQSSEKKQQIFHRFSIEDWKTTSTQDLFEILPLAQNNATEEENSKKNALTGGSTSNFNPLHIHISAVENMKFAIDTQGSDYEEI